MKVVELKISLAEGNLSRICGSNLFRYTAEAIEDENRYYYHVDGVMIEITQLEYNHVIINPHLYYFSTALKLHHLIKNNYEKYI